MLFIWGSGACGSWFALKELTGDRCRMISHTEKGQAGLKFLLANTNAREILDKSYWNYQGQNLLSCRGCDDFCFNLFYFHGQKAWGCSAICWVVTGADFPGTMPVTTVDFPAVLFHYWTPRSLSPVFAADDAEIFRETIRTVYSNEPLLCVLENVLGLLRVFNVVKKYLDKLTAFRWCYLVIDPRRLGDALSRRRVYIILVHKPLE